MSEEHPSIAVLKRFDPTNVAGTVDVFSDDVVFHFFNPRLPDLHGDYVGHAGVIAFFEKLAQLTGSVFAPNIVSVSPVGDELLVVHRKQAMQFEGRQIETDVVVVWRIVEGQIREVWDIPAVYA